MEVTNTSRSSSIHTYLISNFSLLYTTLHNSSNCIPNCKDGGIKSINRPEERKAFRRFNSKITDFKLLILKKCIEVSKTNFFLLTTALFQPPSLSFCSNYFHSNKICNGKTILHHTNSEKTTFTALCILCIFTKL